MHEVIEVHEVLEVHEVYEVLGGMMCVCVKVCYDLFLNPLPLPLFISPHKCVKVYYDLFLNPLLEG